MLLLMITAMSCCKQMLLFATDIIMFCQQLLTCLLYDRIKSWQICKSWPLLGSASVTQKNLSTWWSPLLEDTLHVVWTETLCCCPQPNIRSSNFQREIFHLTKFDSLSHMLFSAHQSPPEVPLVCPVLAPVSLSVLWRHYYPRLSAQTTPTLNKTFLFSTCRCRITSGETWRHTQTWRQKYMTSQLQMTTTEYVIKIFAYQIFIAAMS